MTLDHFILSSRQNCLQTVNINFHQANKLYGYIILSVIYKTMSFFSVIAKLKKMLLYYAKAFTFSSTFFTCCSTQAYSPLLPLSDSWCVSTCFCLSRDAPWGVCVSTYTMCLFSCGPFLMPLNK